MGKAAGDIALSPSWGLSPSSFFHPRSPRSRVLVDRRLSGADEENVKLHDRDHPRGRTIKRSVLFYKSGKQVE
jgi:hypothetical protein